MRVPVWVTLLVAAMVIVFGLYRIRLALKPRPPESDAPPSRVPSRSLFAGGFYRMSGRGHLFVGIIYLLLGAALVATSFGFNPFGNTFGPDTETPSKDNAPVKKGAIPIDQIPVQKK